LIERHRVGCDACFPQIVAGENEDRLVAQGDCRADIAGESRDA
jgi:hypothetical protein